MTTLIPSLSPLSASFPTAEVAYDDMIGWPYLRGGRDASGIDCLGVVLEVYRRAGLGLPDPDQTGKPWEFSGIFGEIDEAAAGTLYDLVYFDASSAGLAVVVRENLLLTAQPKIHTRTMRLASALRLPETKAYRVRAEALP